MNDVERVLYITYDGVMEPVGASQVLTYLKRLSEKGVKLHLISFEKNEDLKNTELKNDLRSELERCGISWHILRYHKRFRLIATLFDVICGIYISMLIFIKTKIKIIHARSYVAGAIAFVISLFTGARVIFDMRGFWADERVDAGLMTRGSVLYRTIKNLEKIFLNKASKIIVLTNEAKKILIGTFDGLNARANEIEVIPCCVDTELFKYDNNARNEIREKYNVTDRVIFVHTGSLIGWYLIKEMLEFFKTIKEKEDKALFMILSKGANKETFFMIVDKIGLSKEDILLTETPFSEVYRYLSAGDAGLFFIKPSFSKRASCPIKLAEYLSSGLPVICNRDVGDINNIIEDNQIGVLVEDFNEVSYNRAYIKLSGMLNREEIKKRCRTVAEKKFSLQKGANSYYDAYRSVQ